MTVPKGKGALQPLRLRPWQVDLVGSVLDPVPPRSATWMLPRGQGKSSLVAGLGLYDLHLGDEGAQVVVVAVDERQAGIILGAAVRMTELNEDLAARTQVFKDKLYVPSRAATFQVLPGQRPKALEGLDPSLALVDEVGVVSREAYEVVALATGKRERSLLLGIGTPGPDWQDSVLGDARAYALEHPGDDSAIWREYSAAGFEDHPVDCQHCWALANPAMGDFLFESGVRSMLPPKMRESAFRRARLCQFVDELEESWLPPSAWQDHTDPRPVPDGAEVVLALDGSFNQDATALVVCELADVPHLDVAGLWEPPNRRLDWRVPVLEVEQAIREACRRWNVREVVADPFRWTRTLQLLEDEGLPMIEFPQSASRMTPATTGLYEAVVNGAVTHSGDARLARHVGNATVKTDARGTRIYKKNGDRGRRIDLAVCAIMAHSRAVYLASRPEPRVRWL